MKSNTRGRTANTGYGTPRLDRSAFGTAGWQFLASTIVANLVGSYFWIYQFHVLGLLVFALLSTAFAGFVGAMGLAWKQTHAGDRPRARRSLIVAVAALSPFLMLAYPWPLHIAYLVSKPALENLADHALAGDTPPLPRWAGVFHVVDVAVDGGAVALVVRIRYGGRDGLSRMATACDAACPYGPISNLNWNRPLSARWRYQSED
ncbi:MAG: hypothetical protein V3V08_15440 [Nannocystaceae bacterium]